MVEIPTCVQRYQKWEEFFTVVPDEGTGLQCSSTGSVCHKFVCIAQKLAVKFACLFLPSMPKFKNNLDLAFVPFSLMIYITFHVNLSVSFARNVIYDQFLSPFILSAFRSRAISEQKYIGHPPASKSFSLIWALSNLRLQFQGCH